MEAAWCVVATVGTDVSSSGQSTLVNVWGKRKHASSVQTLKKSNLFLCIVRTFTRRSIYITQLEASAAVALVGAINVGTLLTAGIALTLIEVWMSASQRVSFVILLVLKNLIQYKPSIFCKACVIKLAPGTLLFSKFKLLQLIFQNINTTTLSLLE